MTHPIVYQVVDSDMFLIGIYDDLELAKREVNDLYKKKGGFYQINEIQMNTIGTWSEQMNDVYTIGNLDKEMGH